MTNITCSGGLFLAKDTQRFLFLLRAQGKTAGTWGLVGGKKEPSDITAYDALLREIQEEIGSVPNNVKPVPLEWYSSRDDMFSYHTYVMIVEHEFIPLLNEEHTGYCWVGINDWPRPLHSGVRNTLISRTTKGKIQTILDVIR
jgi:8-oxo-dGTP pyrophosphatase MutT (NUDIX family)